MNYPHSLFTAGVSPKVSKGFYYSKPMGKQNSSSIETLGARGLSPLSVLISRRVVRYSPLLISLGQQTEVSPLKMGKPLSQSHLQGAVYLNIKVC
jgi:hypothetical protein